MSTVVSTVVGKYTYIWTTSYSPTPTPTISGDKVVMNPDYRSPVYQLSTTIIITVSCLIPAIFLIVSAVYYCQYRAWRLEEKVAFELVYPADNPTTGAEVFGDGDSGEYDFGSLKFKSMVQMPESAVVAEREKGSKKMGGFTDHRVSHTNNSTISPHSPRQPQLQPQHNHGRMVQKTDEVVKTEIAPGQNNEITTGMWTEDDRYRYYELCELTKSPVFVQQHNALLLQQAFQPLSPVVQSSSPTHSQSLQSLQPQQRFPLEQHQHLQNQQQQDQPQRQQLQHQQEKEPHEKEQQQQAPFRKSWQVPLGFYEQLFRKKSSALLKASLKWGGGMDSMSPALSASPSPGVLSATPPSITEDLYKNSSNNSRSMPPPGLTRLNIANAPLTTTVASPPKPPPANIHPYWINIGGAHYCLTPDSTTPSPASPSAPPSSTVVGSIYQPSLHSVPIVDSPTLAWTMLSGPAFGLPASLSTTYLQFPDGMPTPSSASASPTVSIGLLPRGVGKRTVHACVVPPLEEDEEDEGKEEGERDGGR